MRSMRSAHGFSLRPTRTTLTLRIASTSIMRPLQATTIHFRRLATATMRCSPTTTTTTPTSSSMSASSSNNASASATAPSAVEERNDWQEVLAGCVNVSTGLSHSTVLMLGDRACGKTELIGQLKALAHSQRSSSTNDKVENVALGYTFVDMLAADDSGDVVARLNVWSLEGETCHKQLMRSVLGTASALQECVVVIALDMSSPWHLLASLRKWLDVLAAFVQQTFDAARLATLQRHISRRFASYVDPTRANAAAAAQLAADVAAQLELGPGTLTHNLGVPIVVTCCKSDYYETLERDFDFTDASFEHIEQALRTVCLEYGAALCYTSASRATNIAELLALIRSGLAVAASSADSTTNSTTSATAAAAVAQPAPLTDAKERVCIPFGFDSLAKIKVGRAADAAPLERFAEALPPNRRALHAQSESIDAATTAEADAEFIARMRAICDAEPAPVVGTGGNAAAAAAAAAAASVAAGATPTAAATLTSAPSAVPAGLSTPVAAKPSPLKSTSTAASVNVSDKGEREVLSDFFNSLMTKTPTKSSTPNSK